MLSALSGTGSVSRINCCCCCCCCCCVCVCVCSFLDFFAGFSMVVWVEVSSSFDCSRSKEVKSKKKKN